jgi:hypothetical protein
VDTGGNPELLPMTIWKYRAFHEVNEEGEVMEWNRHTHASDIDQVGYPIHKPGEDYSSCKIVVAELEDLHFGRIDNLISLNEDNKIYFCFKLNKATHGDTTLSFNFDYADYGANTENLDPRHSIDLYDKDGKLVNLFPTESNANPPLQYYPNATTGTQSQMMDFLQFTYCVVPANSAEVTVGETTQVVGPDSTGDALAKFKSLTFVGMDPANPTADKPIQIGQGPVEVPEGATPRYANQLGNIDISQSVGTGEDYYLYICMTPNLETYGLHEHILEFFAQSYMFFDVTFSFEVH